MDFIPVEEAQRTLEAQWGMAETSQRISSGRSGWKSLTML